MTTVFATHSVLIEHHVSRILNENKRQKDKKSNKIHFYRKQCHFNDFFDEFEFHFYQFVETDDRPTVRPSFLVVSPFDILNFFFVFSLFSAFLIYLQFAWYRMITIRLVFKWKWNEIPIPFRRHFLCTLVSDLAFNLWQIIIESTKSG